MDTLTPHTQTRPPAHSPTHAHTDACTHPPTPTAVPWGTHAHLNTYICMHTWAHLDTNPWILASETYRSLVHLSQLLWYLEVPLEQACPVVSHCRWRSPGVLDRAVWDSADPCVCGAASPGRWGAPFTSPQPASHFFISTLGIPFPHGSKPRSRTRRPVRSPGQAWDGQAGKQGGA